MRPTLRRRTGVPMTPSTTIAAPRDVRVKEITGESAPLIGDGDTPVVCLLGRRRKPARVTRRPVRTIGALRRRKRSDGRSHGPIHHGRGTSALPRGSHLTTSSRDRRHDPRRDSSRAGPPRTRRSPRGADELGRCGRSGLLAAAPPCGRRPHAGART